MRRSASEIINNLEMRVARLENKSNIKRLAKSVTVKVKWDFEDTDLEDLPYRQALRESGLREKIKLPSSLIREIGGLDEDESDSIISDFLSDEYGFTHYGWEFV